MRIAINSIFREDVETIDANLGLLPDPSCFPVCATFEKNKLKRFSIIDIETMDEASAAASILANMASLFYSEDVKIGMSPAAFAKVIEDRHGRQVIIGTGGKVISINKLKEKTDAKGEKKIEKTFRPAIDGQGIEITALAVDAASEKEAFSKLRIRFANEAASNKEVAKLIGKWFTTGCKVEEMKTERVVSFIDLAEYK